MKDIQDVANNETVIAFGIDLYQFELLKLLTVFFFEQAAEVDVLHLQLKVIVVVLVFDFSEKTAML